MTVTGWLLDSYPQNDGMVFWIRRQGGSAVKLKDKSWAGSIYVAADASDDLHAVLHDREISQYIRDHQFLRRQEKLTDQAESIVLKLTLGDFTKIPSIARRIERLGGGFGRLRLYNVDLLPAQSYFYEHGIFPLAYCEVRAGNARLEWNLMDDVWSTSYVTPDFRTINLDVKIKKDVGTLPKFSDKLASVVIRNGSEIYEIACSSEADIFYRAGIGSRQDRSRFYFYRRRRLVSLSLSDKQGGTERGRPFAEQGSRHVLGQACKRRNVVFFIRQDPLQAIRHKASRARPP